ncbi:MAG: hypothetical protein ACFFCW_31605 [Candidatus Hodarchaeota archaeon]
MAKPVQESEEVVLLVDEIISTLREVLYGCRVKSSRNSFRIGDTRIYMLPMELNFIR